MKTLTYGITLLVAIVIAMQFAKGSAEKSAEKVESTLNRRFSEEAILGK